MRRHRGWVAPLLCLLLAACGRQDAASRDAALAVEFEGERPCVDCDGIASRLRLEQQGDARRYRMLESYHLAGDARSFEEAGQWRAEGELLYLDADGGGTRVYMRLEDGSLEARDGRGLPMPALADERLSPVAFGPGQ